MDIGSIFLILAVLIPTVVFIARPLMEHKSTAVTLEEHDYSALLAERDRIITALQELEFDHTLGKIPEEPYQAQRASLMRYGADILRHIDEYQERLPAADMDQRLEHAIADRKAVSVAPVATADPDDELEALIAARRRTQKSTGQTSPGGFCPNCGNCVHETDRFCPKCGVTLA